MKDAIPAYIYGLRAVDSDRYFYVGSTARTIKIRLGQHFNSWRQNRNNHFVAVMRRTGRENIQADLLESTTVEQRFILEAEWIARLLSEGHPLTNQQLSPHCYTREHNIDPKRTRRNIALLLARAPKSRFPELQAEVTELHRAALVIVKRILDSDLEREMLGV